MRRSGAEETASPCGDDAALTELMARRAYVPPWVWWAMLAVCTAAVLGGRITHHTALLTAGLVGYVVYVVVRTVVTVRQRR